MKQPEIIFATVAANLLGACAPPPEFAVSLSDPGQAEHEKWLLGNWYGGDIDGSPAPVQHLSIADRSLYWTSSTYASGEWQRDGRLEHDPSLLNISLVFQVSEGQAADIYKFLAFPSDVDGTCTTTSSAPRRPVC